MAGGSRAGASIGISVHIDALGKFAQAVDAVKDAHAHAVGEISTVFNAGVPFGLDTPSDAIHAAVNRYFDTTGGTTDQMTAFYLEMIILADTARQISVNYRTVDALRAATVQDITTAVDLAIGTDTPPPPTPGADQAA